MARTRLSSGPVRVNSVFGFESMAIDLLRMKRSSAWVRESFITA